MGALEVALEFQSIPDLRYFVENAGPALGRKFALFTQATIHSVPTRKLTWLRIKNVPLGSWNTRFFSSFVSSWGTFVKVDDNTRDRV